MSNGFVRSFGVGDRLRSHSFIIAEAVRLRLTGDRLSKAGQGIPFCEPGDDFTASEALI